MTGDRRRGVHDLRCCGDCGPCGGIGGVETHICLTCGGDGKCRGCAPFDVQCVACLYGTTWDEVERGECPQCGERTLVDLRNSEAEIRAETAAIQAALTRTHGPASGW